MENNDKISLDSDFTTGNSSLPNSTAVLVLGIISIVTCWLYGIPGLICGIIALILAKKDLALYKKNPNQYTLASYKNLKAGQVCGIIGLCLSGLFVLYLIVVAVIIGGAMAGAAGSGVFDNLDQYGR